MRPHVILFILSLVALVTGAIWFKPGLVALALFLWFGCVMTKAAKL